MFKKITLGALVLSLGLSLAACGSSDVSTGGSGNSTEKNEETTEKKEAKKDDGSKRIDASNQSVDALGMKVNLGEIKIAEDKISVGMNIENTTDKALSFYPDQGKLVIGDMQLDANMFMTSGQIGGDVQGGVKQEGVIEFLAPEGKKIDVNAVKEIKLLFGDVITEDLMQNKAVEFIVSVE